MSSNEPFEPAPPPPPEPEYLGDGGTGAVRSAGSRPRGRGRRVGFAVAGVAAVAVAGGGAWAVGQLMGGGPAPASALPDDVLAYVSVDLDPSAGQKIEAIKTLRKFPALRDELDLDSRDDVRRWLFSKLQEGDECKGLDYADDVEPWLGDRAAVAAVPNDEHVADPLFAVQVKDQGKAETGLKRLFDACGGEEFGSAFVGDYMLVAESQQTADDAAAAARRAPLADDADFKDAMNRIGDIGVLTAWISPDGPKAIYGGLADLTGAPADDACDASTDSGVCAPAEDLESRLAEQQDRMNQALKDFSGLALTVRFDGGGIELAMGGRTVPGLATLPTGSTSLGDLPDTTIGALGFALPEGWADGLTKQLRANLGDRLYQDMLREAEQQTGLELPADLETLFGKDTVVALDGSTDFGALSSGSAADDLSALKAGIRASGDEAAIRAVLERLLDAGGDEVRDAVKVESTDGRVAVGFDEDYTRALAAGGDLGDQDRFSDAVPRTDAPFALFVDFDSADHWLDRAVQDSGGDAEDVANVEPLSALGASMWTEDHGWRFELRLATD